MMPPPYKLYVSMIPQSDALPVEDFKKTRWASYYTADLVNLVSNGKTNPNHLFEVFGKFNGKTGCEVRLSLLKHIESNMDFYERRSTVCLRDKGMRFDSWIESIGNESTFCDELALMGLCALYTTDTVWYLRKYKFWSTLDTTSPIGFMKLLQLCSVKLIYLGDLKFGVLHWQPRPPKTKQVKPSTGTAPLFSIVEEYTIDDSPPETAPIDLTLPASKPSISATTPHVTYRQQPCHKLNKRWILLSKTKLVSYRWKHYLTHCPL